MYIQPSDHKQAADWLPFLLASTLPYRVEYHRALGPCRPSMLSLRAPYASLFSFIYSLMVVAGVGGPACTSVVYV